MEYIKEGASDLGSGSEPRSSLKRDLAKHRKKMWCVNTGQQPHTHPAAHPIPSSTEQGEKKDEKACGSR